MTDLRTQQLQFANYIRNPDIFPAPEGIEERRLQIYRDLFFNNIESLLAGTFPVIRSILDDDRWQRLVRDFYTMHRCETPLFPWIAGEFVDYLLNERDEASDYPFLVELAHYEWSEIALRHETSEAVEMNRVGDKPMLSPLCWPLSYQFPVHRIGRCFLPQQAPDVPTCLLVYRPQQDEVKFMESSPATLRLLQLLEDEALPDLEAVCRQLAMEMQYPDPEHLQQMVLETLHQLRRLGIVINL